ncbi:hypothetical protein TcCL_NonESM05343 [Trypanosoma cruzi]|uniref:Uncharacterized protein n=1 Tax=Trypanosoma cruzi (strain CL Brener) TaxID=353153 RepID=Q4D902_TRYCC|nr:hypothetical protein Tc00.1047053505171.90 [Trypanosoma cruzi]EAN89010.1 hypothetical protein Tc00.1047053505171.90 [Trypanosoma cruzi]RNC44930.1 hypothetical protein TcCL_NonESM05343 [Trypanosoma cruzi]|eukprot:XP_810861.1 hypothetical protein [Trypanosoma cruzi strain CL Brener]
MFLRLATVGAFVTVLVAFTLLHGDELWGFGPQRRRGNSPCECLTGVIGDSALLGALHRKSLFLGLHWRATPAHVMAYLDPWQLKYANCISFHRLELSGIKNDTSAVDVLRERLEEDAANDTSGSWMIRDRGLMASRQRHRQHGRLKTSAAEPTCHVWILPETARIPLTVWVALKGLLQEGTIADVPVRLSARETKWSMYQPLGVLLWADPADRETLKHVVPPRTVMMFTTISR